MINEQAIKEYVDNKGEKCPFCHSHSVCGGTINDSFYTTTTEIHLTTWCDSCDKEWTDIYQLVSIRV